MSGSVAEAVADKRASRQLVDSDQRPAIEPKTSDMFDNLIKAAEPWPLIADPRSRDRRINALVPAAEEQLANHKNASLHSLSLYETVRGKQNDELSSLLSNNASLKEDVGSGITTVDELRRAETELGEKLGRLQDSVKTKEDALRDMAKKMKDLEHGSSKTKVAKEQLEVDVQKLQATLSEYSDGIGRSRDKTDTLAKSYKHVSGELKAIRNPRATRHNESKSEV
ncbi:hypothetical protein LTR53_007777, partial [Teratosphaeriaceae sp. CCFEE 6253]